MNSERTLPIFVLTLEGADTRRAPLLKLLDDLQLDYELFFGVDGRENLPRKYEELVDRSARVETRQRPMTDGEYACSLSHLFIYRQILERGLALAIVLEDDAVIGSAFAALARRKISVPGDLVMLDHDRGFFRWRAGVPIAKGLYAYPIAVPPTLNTGYILNRCAAEYLLDHAFPVCTLADWPAEITRLTSLAIHPRIVDHLDPAATGSYLQGARVALRNNHKAKLPKGWKRWFTKAYWLRRQRDWYGIRYRKLDAAVRLYLLD